MKRHIPIFAFLLGAFAATAQAVEYIDIVHETTGVVLKQGARSAEISIHDTNLDLYYQWYGDDLDLVAPEKDGYTVSWLTLPVDDEDSWGSHSRLADFTVPIGSGPRLTAEQMKAVRRSNALPDKRVARLRYDAMPLTVTFNPSGGGGAAMQPVTGKDFTSEFDLPANAFTKTGHSFANWTNAVGRVFTDGQSVKGSDFWNPAITNFSAGLVAVWTPNVYTVTFDGNGGGTPSPTSKTVTYDSTYGDLATCEREGWQFKGWYTSTDGGSKIEPTTKVAIISNQTLYAQWTQKFTVTFREDEKFNDTTPKKDGVLKVESVVKGESAMPPANPVHTGYRFTGWSGNYTGVTRDENVYATYQANSYRVVFHANDGSGRTKEQPFDYGEEKPLFDNPLPRMGYTLYGWVTNETSTTKVYDNKQTVANLATGGTVDLYALWTPISYTVAFDRNGGEGTMNPASLTYGTLFTVPDCEFTKTGCEFKWWSAEIGGVATNFEAGAVVSNLTSEAGATVTFRAEWIGYYTVAFNANGGTGTMTNLTYETGVEYALPSNAFTKTGYRFDVWDDVLNKERYEDGAKVRDLAEAGETNTLLAVWRTNAYTVVFNPNGGTGTMANQPFVYDQPQQLRKCDFIHGDPELWSFAGWTNSVAGGPLYTNQETVVNLTAEPDGRVELIAVWSSMIGPLSEAMDCGNLKWENEVGGDVWVVCRTFGVGGSCAQRVPGGSMKAMVANISTNGTLKFKWQPEVGTEQLGVVIGPNGGTPYIDVAKSGIAGQWNDLEFEIPPFTYGDTDIRIEIYFSGGGSCYVDQMTWVPEGTHPVPTDANKVTISSAAVSNGKFTLSFEFNEDFDYLLKTNANLLIDSWGDMEIEGKKIDNILTFEPQIIEGQPQMFYRVDTIRKK